MSSPIQTSPNWPAPSFFSSFSDDLGISQASFSQGFSGLELKHGFVSVWQRPSPCSNKFTYTYGTVWWLFLLKDLLKQNVKPPSRGCYLYLKYTVHCGAALTHSCNAWPDHAVCRRCCEERCRILLCPGFGSYNVWQRRRTVYRCLSPITRSFLWWTREG